MDDLLTGDIPKSPVSVKKYTGVTHLNKKPLFVIVATAGILLTVAAYALQKMSARQHRDAEEQAENYQAITQDSFVNSYLSDRSDGVIQARPEPIQIPPELLREEPVEDLQKVSIRPEPVEEPAPQAQPLRACGTEEECAMAAELRQQAMEAVLHERIRVAQLRRNQLESAASAPMRVNFNRSGDPETGICSGDNCDESESNSAQQRQPDPAATAGDLIRARGAANLDNMLALLNNRISSATGDPRAANALIESISGASNPGSGGSVIGGAGSDGGISGGASGAASGVPGLNAALQQASHRGSLNLGELGIRNTNRQTGFLTGQAEEEDSDYLEESLRDPRSDIELKAGTLIRASLLTGINSELPGQIIGQVTCLLYTSDAADE